MRKILCIILAMLMLASSIIAMPATADAAGFVTKTYYIDKAGKTVTGSKKIDGDRCYFNKSTGELEGRILKITYINQDKGVRKNKKWKYTSFCNKKTSTGKLLRYTACGITSCAMAITALRGKLTLPSKFNNRKYGFNGNGSDWNVGVLTAKKYGLHGKVRSLAKNQAINYLLKGRFIVCWVTDSIYGGGGNPAGGDIGHGKGHFILIHGYWKGKFAVADPNNLSQTYVWSKKLQTWESFNDHLGNGKKSYCVIW